MLYRLLARTVVIHQDTMRRAVEIVELPAFQRVPEHGANQKGKTETDRNQQEDDIDSRYSNAGTA